MNRILSLLLGACLLATPAAAEPVELRVMIFNIWLGGEQVSMTKTLEAIQAADADLVLLQEAEGNTALLAERLGYADAAPRQHLLSRYPIFDASDSEGDLAYVEIAPGRFVAVANVHLDWSEYGPYAARDGSTAEAILLNEQDLRLSGIQVYLDLLEPIAAGGMPVLIGGDFNSPGDDWTEAMVGQRPHIAFPLAWPAAKAVRDAGYLDTWRAVHPDAVANPGITWSWGYPQPTLWEGETQDRIDLLFARNAEVADAQLVGGADLPDVAIAVTPWPSDHQAVVATLLVEGAPAPTMIVPVRRAVTQGEVMQLRYTLAGTADGRLEDGWVEILPPGGAVGEALQILYTSDTTDRMALLKAATFDLAPGAWDAALVDSEGSELARTTFHVLAPGAKPAIASDKASYKPGETILGRVVNAPGDRYDWVALFPAGEADQWNYLGSAYTGGFIAGEVTLDEETLGRLEPGDYELRLLADDGYRAIARSAVFTVTAE